ncbi:hypothetical protein AAHE18_12G005000 [Arachis hypogaea]
MPKKQYRFDRVYTPKDDQVDVFADASSMVTSVLDGYNVCIFAYGPTGAGKTFTMEGTELNRGVNYRTLELLFDLRKKGVIHFLMTYLLVYLRFIMNKSETYWLQDQQQKGWR